MCPAPRTGASAPPSRSRSRPLDARSARAATVSPPAASTMGNGRSPQTRVELRHRPARRVLAKARAGDRTAFEQVYRRFERPVFAMALRICGDREEAFEVLQETMLKVYDRIGGFRGESPFWAWLRRIALNEALMALRRGRRLAEELPMEDGFEAVDEFAPPPPAAADAALLQRALEALPRPPGACCGSTTPRATPTRKSPPPCTGPPASPSRSSRAAPAACACCLAAMPAPPRRPPMGSADPRARSMPATWGEAFAALPMEAPPAGGWDAVAARLDARRPRVRPPLWLAMAAALALLAIALPWRTVGPGGPGFAPPSPQSARAAGDR